MVKNITGGNKTKKQKRNYGRFDAVEKVENEQMFAQIIHNNGGTFDILCSDGVSRKGRLANYMKNGPRVKAGSYVVISLREFETEQKNCDIIGYGDPPNDVIALFNKDSNNTNKKGEISFVDNEDKFKDIDEINKTVNIDNTNNINKINDFDDFL